MHVFSVTMANKGIAVRIPAGTRNFLFSEAPRLALGRTTLPSPWVQEDPSAALERLGIKLTTHRF